MKVLYFNPICFRGHRAFDSKMIHNLSMVSELYVLISGFEGYLCDADATYIRKLVDIKTNSRFMTWYKAFLNCMIAAKFITENKIEIVVFGSYVFPIMPFLLLQFNKNTRIILCEHNNIDQADNSLIKGFIYRLAFNCVKHCVFEPFIYDDLINRNYISKESVLMWPFPIEKSFNKERASNSYKYICIGLSNSNDKSVIERIISEEKNTEILKKKGLKVILKSSTENVYDDNALKVLSGWIDEQKYNDLYHGSLGIMIPFPKSYNNRVSNTLLEGIVEKKVVIGSNIKLMRYYRDNYPGLVIIYDDDDVMDVILQIEDFKFNEKSYKRLLEDHSDKRIQEIMLKDLKRMVIE